MTDCKRTIIVRALALIMLLTMLLPAYIAAAEPAQVTAYNAEMPEVLMDSHLAGASCVLIDSTTGTVLYDKGAEQKRYPASTTKIMTLLLAVEYGHFDDIITIPKEADNVPSDSSKTPVYVGEEMKFIDLLYGMMLPSGNDSSNAVAVIVGGSLESFAARMNERAREIGCTGTNFMNAHGYHNENHYTTALDLARITAVGMKNETFRMIVSTMTYVLPKSNKRTKSLEITTHTKMLLPNSDFYYEPIAGVKTGFHSASSQCFVAAAAKDNMELISVTLKTTNDGRWNDSRRMMEYGFTRFEPVTFEQAFKRLEPMLVAVQNYAADDPQNGQLELSIQEGGTLNPRGARILPENETTWINALIAEAELSYIRPLEAPISKGEPLVTISIDGYTATLIASRDVAEYVPEPEVEDEPDALDQLIEDIAKENDSILSEAPELSDPRVLIGLGAAVMSVVILLIMMARVHARRERRRKEALRRRRAKMRRQRRMDEGR